MSKKILIFYPNNPFTHKHGVHTRFLQLLKYFNSRNFTIDLLTHNNRMDNWPHQFDITKPPFNILRNITINDFQKSKNVHSSFLTKFKKKIIHRDNTNLDFPDFAFPALRKDFNKMLNNDNYDFILISLIQWANLIDEVKHDASIIKILTIEDILAANLYEWTNGKINFVKCLKEEINRINKFDKIIFISNDDKIFYERICKNKNFYYIPHSIQKKDFIKSSKKNIDILYVASNNPFNCAGAKWFFNSIYPLLDKKYIITIIGNITQHLQDYRNLQNVTFIEYAPELDDYYRQSKVAICPLLAGSGLKIKVIEAISFGLPVVSTKWGLTGLKTTETSGLLEASTPETFAYQLKLLLNDNIYYNTATESLHKYFLNNFEENNIFEKLDSVFS